MGRATMVKFGTEMLLVSYRTSLKVGHIYLLSRSPQGASKPLWSTYFFIKVMFICLPAGQVFMTVFMILILVHVLVICIFNIIKLGDIYLLHEQ